MIFEPPSSWIKKNWNKSVYQPYSVDYGVGIVTYLEYGTEKSRLIDAAVYQEAYDLKWRSFKSKLYYK